MKSRPAHIPSVLTWHYWATLLRLLISLTWGVMFTVSLGFGYRRSSGDFIYPIPFLLMAVNDILILLLDFKRTDSYVGTVLAQITFSVLSLAPPEKNDGHALAAIIGLFGYLVSVYLTLVIQTGSRRACVLEEQRKGHAAWFSFESVSPELVWASSKPPVTKTRRIQVSPFPDCIYAEDLVPPHQPSRE
ncbi:hypothetical protein FRC07_002192 [Ceratobasidium sp. 392]|nr:hypothetical protein FRC07_002192 [Ceratobasidium sp. 392]